MASERTYNHKRRVCTNHLDCTWPVCECPVATVPELLEDKEAIHRELQEQRRRRTTRVKAVLP